MNDRELLRYSRQIFLPEVDIVGQEKINNARVLLLGLGGLGSVVAMYLAAAGVRNLTIIDYDTVDLSNLQRQILYNEEDVNHKKAIVAKDKLLKINPYINIEAITTKLSKDEAIPYVTYNDLIVDASDNFATRVALNSLAVALKKPYIFAAAINWHGQVGLFQGHIVDWPCYNCVFAEELSTVTARCSETGVLGPVVGIVASMQALLTLQVIIGFKHAQKLHNFDALTWSFKTSSVVKDPKCLVCNN